MPWFPVVIVGVEYWEKLKEQIHVMNLQNTISPDDENLFLVTDDLDEAQLINHITDYKGGVEYVLRNPAEAKQVSDEIRAWAEKKGFVVLKRTMSNNGKIGYFYFKLGQDPALESQRIQGYIAQKPEIKHFRFNVKGQKKIQPRRENPTM